MLGHLVFQMFFVGPGLASWVVAAESLRMLLCLIVFVFCLLIFVVLVWVFTSKVFWLFSMVTFLIV